VRVKRGGERPWQSIILTLIDVDSEHVELG
jgi:hypothetical protein